MKQLQCTNDTTRIFSKRILCLLTALHFTCFFIQANNITVNNFSLTGQNTASDFALIQFDISWDNSWRINSGPSNWDAAWVFAKYKVNTQTTWNHATLNYVDGTGSGDGHSEPTTASISSSDDTGSGGSHGVFIHPNADMVQASVNYTNIQLRWNYGVDGVTDNDTVEICVFAIEMVYIPQSSFFVGSGGAEAGAFYTYPTTTTPYQITSENSITVGTTNGNLYYPSIGLSGDQNGPIPASFPKGYDAFYCMKYEITQDQYVAFLNKLDPTQAASRAYTSGGFRNGISGSPGNYITSNPYVACNYLGWPDLAAYLDWAALRPMTELEFEKAGRGTLSPIANEYAWGSTSFTAALGITNAGLGTEIASNASANCVCDATFGGSGVQGPMRVGHFAKIGTTREQAGASYYGIMELSGNLLERPVTVGNASGRAFTNTHGDGQIDASGDANVATWPNSSASGSGLRGGTWYDDPTLFRLSDRFYTSLTANGRDSDVGGRGVRQAP